MEKVVVSAGVLDSAGIVATTNAYLDVSGATTIAALQAGIDAWLTLLKDTTNGRIVACSEKLIQDVSAHSGDTIAAGSAVGLVTVLKFPVAAPGSPWDFVIPARDPATILGGRPDTETEGSTLDRFADSMEGGFTGATFVSSNGNDLQANAGGFLSTRKHRRKTQLRSRQSGA